MLLEIVVFVAILVGAVVATADADAWWTAALAVAGLVIAALGIALAVRDMLRAGEASPATPGRGRVAAAAVVGAVAVVPAFVVPIEDSAATSTAHATAGDAAQTVRDFLADAVLDDNAYAACQYLTPGAQLSVARLAGDDQTCRDALTATQPSLGTIHSEGALHALRLDAVVRDGTASVTARPPGPGPVTFVLSRTTPADTAVYGAPSSEWRIADGATAVLRFLAAGRRSVVGTDARARAAGGDSTVGQCHQRALQRRQRENAADGCETHRAREPAVDVGYTAGDRQPGSVFALGSTSG
ncbi:MAG TPA: hypothetical protein VFY45_19230 [Baekduia sp.]|nr:hypothetical protein [Baekduia sp.]